jgi:hypothetical protein
MVPHLLESIAGKPTSLFSTPHKIYVPLQQVTIWKVKIYVPLQQVTIWKVKMYYPLHVFPFRIHMKLGCRII